MKRTFSLLVVLLLALTLAACSNDASFDFDRGYIVVGMEADYPPFNWLETESNDYNHPIHGTNDFVAGYDVDIAISIAEELDLELRIVALAWEALIPALQTGTIDIIVAGMSPRPDRLEQINFTNDYYTVRHVVVVRADDVKLANATELAHLEGAVGVGQIGTIYADLVDYIVDNHGATALPVMDTVPQIVTAITSEVADFTVVEKPVAESIVRTNDNFTIILESSETNNIYEVSAEDRELSIGLRKVDSELLNLINNALKNATQAMRDAWMDEALTLSE